MTENEQGEEQDNTGVSVEADFENLDGLDDLEETPDSEMDDPLGSDSEASEGESSPIEEALAGTPRVLQDGKENRKAVTAYINRMMLYELSDLQTQLGREFNPDPRKLDVYAAIFYAGLPTTDRSMREFLREFGYRDEQEKS